VLGGAMISMGRTLEKLGLQRYFTRVRGSGILRTSSLRSSRKSRSRILHSPTLNTYERSQIHRCSGA
jgi:hypothetical protein